MDRFNSQAQFQGGAPTGSPILARVIGLARPLMGAVGVASTAIIAANFILPAGYGPSTWIGKFHGGIESADADAKADAVTSLTRKSATAAAEPPAMAQMETNAFAVQQQTMQQSLGVQNFMANMADFACVAGSMMSAVPNTSPDTRQAAQVLQQGCMAGDAIRANEMRVLKQAGQGGSTVIRRSIPQ